MYGETLILKILQIMIQMAHLIDSPFSSLLQTSSPGICTDASASQIPVKNNMYSQKAPRVTYKISINVMLSEIIERERVSQHLVSGL